MVTELFTPFTKSFPLSLHTIRNALSRICYSYRYRYSYRYSIPSHANIRELLHHFERLGNMEQQREVILWKNEPAIITYKYTAAAVAHTSNSWHSFQTVEVS